MKKLLISTLIISSTFSSLAASNNFYLKAGLGANSTGDFKENEQKFRGGTKPLSTIAIGYNINDDFRTDLSFDYVPFTTYSAQDEKNIFVYDSYKASSINLMLNGFYNIAQISDFKFFLGAGVGISKINARSSKRFAPVFLPFYNVSMGSVKLKQTSKFSYAAYGGTSYEVRDGIHADLTLSYKNLGSFKTNSKKKVKMDTIATTLGIRFDI